MLAVGRAKVERESLSERIELVQGDAESAAYGREAFDAATVAFGVRNFEDIPGGLTGLFSVPPSRACNGSGCGKNPRNGSGGESGTAHGPPHIQGIPAVSVPGRY